MLQARPITTAAPAGDDKRGWYLTLRPGMARLRQLRTRVAEELIPALEAEGNRLAGEDLEARTTEQLAEAIEERLASVRQWTRTYCEEFIHAITAREDFLNPNVVKVVTDQTGHALYFSRAPIPWPRDAMQGGSTSIRAFRRHWPLCLPCRIVSRYAAWPAAPIETLESLEQLRVLWHGEKIAVVEADEAPASGVDTPEDLGRVRQYFREKSKEK